MPAGDTFLARVKAALEGAADVPAIGTVTRLVGLTIEGRGPLCTVGELCRIHPLGGGKPIPAEVVGFHERAVLMMPLGDVTGLGPGSRVEALGRPLSVAVGDGILGRVVDGLGRPLDGGPPIAGTPVPLDNHPPQPLRRRRVNEPLSLGVRAVDALLTCGKGQRLGIFAGSGVGKSTLLAMMARNTEADVTCIGLIGERGREVREFLERDLGEEGLRRSVVVVATSDQPPLVRVKAALLVTAIAEYFRDRGRDVLLLMDSVTRVALAQREVGLATGEPPATRGYTPSVFTFLARLLERAGPGEKGSITGLYTVLVEGDDMMEPVADTVRGILDGHVVLSRRLAEMNHYPAIDVLASVSRLMIELATPEQRAAAGRVREILATYNQAEDLVNIGAYVAGANPRIDNALARIDAVRRFLQQDPWEKAPMSESIEWLVREF
ncbi:MAG: EscN/YscN/HrcN family type III secretion system ATPase [Bacillota bacterium]|nr:EscN/YscN/HrcN family type III secretion system ATPase [Bacillota bacterium]REJ36410.1 MAG: EscN/YscN/HrcN family type III secretion system ATPase [Bacillota bacterium]